MSQYPLNIPSGARWEANWETKEELWVIGEVRNGLREGHYRYYRKDGTLCSEDHYVNGILHGPAKRFHENGEVAQVGEMSNGLKEGNWQWTRSTQPTTEETIPSQCSDNVWSAARAFSKGNASPALFYDREGRQVLHNGIAVPTRPANLPCNAAYNLSDKNWFHGWIRSNEKPQDRIGNWYWWDELGNLLREAVYDHHCREIEEKRYKNGMLREHKKTDQWNNRSFMAEYDEQGILKLRTEKLFDNKTLLKHLIWGPGEQPVLFCNRLDDDILHCEFYENGNKSAEGMFDNDRRPAGTWKFYLSSGELAHERTVDGVQWDKFSINKDFNPAWVLGELLLQDEAGKPLPASLATADQINWKEMEGAYGKKVHLFPLYIRGMISHHPSVRLVALSEIVAEAEHQGSLYQSTVMIVPFLVAALDHPRSDKYAILRFLNLVMDAVYQYTDEEALQVDPDEQDPEEFDYDDLVPMIIRRLYNGWPVLKSLLHGHQKDILLSTVMLIKAINRPDVEQEIRTLLQNPDPEIRLTALSSLLERTDERAQFLSDPDPLIRLETAIQCTLRTGPHAPDKAVEELIKVWRQKDEELYSVYMRMPFVEQDLYALVCLGLGCNRNTAAQQLLPELCAGLEKQSPFDALTYGRGLLSLALGNAQVPFAPDFLLVLTTLASSKKFFTFINVSDVLNDWRLPVKADALLQLADSVRLEPHPEHALRTFIFRENQ